MRSSGPVVRPLAARRSPTGAFCVSAAECFGVYIFRLSRDNGEHPADQFEFDSVHYASVALALGSLSFVIGAKLSVMVNGTASPFGQYTLYLAMTGACNMVAAID